ncbi:MAG: prophage regulatory protein [Clostridiales bacterium]|nr:prophage regulatory protein [Clostridiales bacterium]MDN5281888.1 prophage regulatory protein [Candidatus Ozemobacter sp.]
MRTLEIAIKGAQKSSEPVTISHPSQLLRLPQVLRLVPVSRSTWLAGVKSGRFPSAIKNNRCVFWRASDVLALLEKMGEQEA